MLMQLKDVGSTVVNQRLIKLSEKKVTILDYSGSLWLEFLFLFTGLKLLWYQWMSDYIGDIP